MGDAESDDGLPSAEESKAAARVLLEHAGRGWSAEEERARLIQRQQQLAVAVLLAATGAFFTAALGMLKGREGFWFWLGLVLLIAALAAAGTAFVRLIRSRRPEPGCDAADAEASASVRLVLGAEAAAIDVEDELVSLNLCFQRTYNAFLDLQARNDRKREEVSLGTGNLVIALGIAFLAVLVLMLAPAPPLP